MKGLRSGDQKLQKQSPSTHTSQPNQARRAILDKIEGRKLRGHNYDEPHTKPQGVRSVERIITVPLSTKNQHNDKISNKKYYKKQYTKVSQETKQRVHSAGDEDHNENKGEIGFERVNSQYTKLHDKLSTLELKISEMKKNLQRKKEEKMKKKQEEEERKNKAKDGVQSKKKVGLGALVTQVPERKELHTFEKNPYSPRHSIYYVSEIVRAYQDPKSLAREHMHTSLQIMAYFEKGERPSDDKMAAKKMKLPRKKGYQDKKTVVFDLDETPIHCNQSLEAPYDIKLPIVFPNGQVIEAGINIRPHAQEILKNLSKNFQVIVFTASHSCYANVVLDHLDPEKQYVHHRLFREHCYATPEGMHVKDLRVIDRQLSDMVLVDNAAYSYIYQLDNGIPILPYYHGNTDFELKALQAYIESMLLLKDMRSANRRTFKLHMYKNYYYDLDKLVEELYLTEHNI